MIDSATLDELRDRQAITDLIYRYCRAMDRIDAELGYTIWHDDGLADYGDGVYRGSGRGFIDFVCAQHRHALTHTHQVTNIVLELDGSKAASESYVFSVLRVAQGEGIRQITTWGRYIDEWSKRSGRWGIDRRLAIRDFDEIRDATPLHDLDQARRDRNDPSYTVLKGPK